MAMGLSAGGALSGAATGASIGSMVPGIGTAIGAIGGGLLGLFSGKKNNSAQRQLANEKELMGLQNQYNTEMAEGNQKRAMEMWNYTNYENQVKHMKNAGLSVGLMYGNGGGMGASTSGGQGAGVSNPGTTAVQQGLQAKMMGVQLGNIQSQTALNAAQAAKNMAEADKIKGVDTKATEATIENVIAQTDNEKAKNGLIYAQKRMAEIQGDLNNANIEEIGYNIRQIEKTIDLMDENITAAKISNEIAQATKKNQIEMSAINVLNGIKDALLKESQGKLTEAEAKAVTVKLAQGWKQLELGESEQALQKLLGEWNNEREYIIGREKIDQQRMSSAIGVMTKAGEVFGRMWKKLGDKLF
jgi:hypothetical protein